MKKWNETQAVLHRLSQLRGEGKRAALATVISISGSAYRREGAKLLVSEDGSFVGNVSGGCLEQDVRETALEVIKTQRPKLRLYCSGADDIGAWDMGLGCDGRVEVYVEPASDDLSPALRALEACEPFGICTRIPSEPGEVAQRFIVKLAGHEGSLGSAALDEAVTDIALSAIEEGRRAGAYQVAGQRIFIDGFIPPPQLVLIGAGDDVRPLAHLGAEAGFRVAVVDRRPVLLTAERFAAPIHRVESEATALAQHLAFDEHSYVVLMTHNYADDKDYLSALLNTDAAYIGLLGPQQRTARLLAALEVTAVSDVNRIHAPVGLDLGGEGAEQVALAIVAEILAFHTGRSGAPLRERARPIHA